jgi:hypothetical protein
MPGTDWISFDANRPSGESRWFGIELKAQSHGGVPPWNPRKSECNEYEDSGVPLTVGFIRGRGDPHKAPSGSPLPLRPHHHSDFPSFLPAAGRDPIHCELASSFTPPGGEAFEGNPERDGGLGAGPICTTGAWGLMGFSLPPASHTCRRTLRPCIHSSGGPRGVRPHGLHFLQIATDPVLDLRRYIPCLSALV